MSAFTKFPFVAVTTPGTSCWSGWTEVVAEWRRELGRRGQKRLVLVVDTYPGVDLAALGQALREGLSPQLCIETSEAMLSPAEVARLVAPDVTSDALFGKLTRLNLAEFFDPQRLNQGQRRLAQEREGLLVVYGSGATLLCDEPADIVVYADLARWEIQQRFRAGRAANLAAANQGEAASLQYKRAFFVDWRVADKHKKPLLASCDYFLDTNQSSPKMMTGGTLRAGLQAATKQPFSLVPFFDPGPWGGQWMKEVCGLDPSAPNYAWCFNCVPEENSLLLGIGDARIEVPAMDLVLSEPRALLGEAVHARFGTEFPIRFDFLDTMGGGPLSLQVHPLTEYIQEQFGMHYTQDESYYIMAAKPGAKVYLGLKEGINPDAMITALRQAHSGGPAFDAERYVETWPCRTHDHFLIPAGTVHCSGADAMVLEISATPYIFTFKLWDWGRLGLDGKPRPINIEHGRRVIQWDRTTAWTRAELVNRTTPIASGDGWREESTGLHEREFIETRRHWFQGPVEHDTNGTVHVLSLVEGSEATVSSPGGAFAPFVVHYAETFIVPAAVGAYTITPSGPAQGTRCATVKAFVRSMP